MAITTTKKICDHSFDEYSYCTKCKKSMLQIVEEESPKPITKKRAK